jgi:hypothetical protein
VIGTSSVTEALGGGGGDASSTTGGGGFFGHASRKTAKVVQSSGASRRENEDRIEEGSLKHFQEQPIEFPPFRHLSNVQAWKTENRKKNPAAGLEEALVRAIDLAVSQGRLDLVERILAQVERRGG